MNKATQFKHPIGALLKDKVTGLTGRVMVRAEYFSGCHHYGLQSETLKDGMPAEWQWLDQSRLEIVDAPKMQFHINPDQTSGPAPSGPSM